MKVLHLTSACTVGGAEAHVLALLGSLDAARYERWLAYFEERPDEARPMVPDFRAVGVRTVDLHGHRQIDPVAIFRLARLLARERFDLVHAHSLRAELAAVIAARLIRPRPRVIRTVHNTDDFYLRPPAAWLARFSGRLLDHVVAISDAVAEHVMRHAGLPGAKVTRIYYGLDASRYAVAARGLAPLSDERAPAELGARPRAAIQGRPVIGMIARLAPQKGHTVLLDALPAVLERFPGLQIELVGHEHLTTVAELREYAERRGVAERVHFAGFRDDLAALFARWDLMVLPSLWEGFGLVLLEAMAAGLPVVASRVGPIPEVVADGETGLLVEPGEPGPLAEAVVRVLEQPELARRLGEAGRGRVTEHFNLDQMVAETEALYRRILGAAPAGGEQDCSGTPGPRSFAALGMTVRGEMGRNGHLNGGKRTAKDHLAELEFVPCPACGHREAVELGEEDGLGIKRCLHCALVYVSPRRAEHQGHYHGGREAILRKYGAILRGEQGHNRDPNYRQELAELARLKPRGRLLDVGTHCGFFLRMARGMGWELQGIEPSAAAELAREFFGLDVLRGHLDELDLPDDRYDVVTLIDVIEHLDNPPALLKAVRRVLKLDGYVFIKTPNARYNLFKDRLIRGTLRLDDIEIFDAKEHVVQYTRETLAWVLDRAGFEVFHDFVPRPVQDGAAWKCALRSTAYGLARMQHAWCGGQFGPLATDLAVVARKRAVEPDRRGRHAEGRIAAAASHDG